MPCRAELPAALGDDGAAVADTWRSVGTPLLVATPGFVKSLGGAVRSVGSTPAPTGVGVAGNLFSPFVMLATYLVTPWLLSSTSMAPSHAAVSARFFWAADHRRVISCSGTSCPVPDLTR